MLSFCSRACRGGSLSLTSATASALPRARGVAVSQQAVGVLTAASPVGCSRRGFFGQSFEVGEIHATRREATGSKRAQAARREHLIPGIIYGYDGAGADSIEVINVAESDLRREVNRRKDCFYNTLYDIVLDGQRTRVLPRDFQIHPFRPKAISINWLRYRPGAYPGAKLDIPLRSFNEERSPGIKEGGWLLELVHKLPVYASGESIPDYLMMDLRGMRAGDKVMASQVELNDGLIMRSKVRDFAIARLLGSRARASPADAAAAASPSGKAPAAGDDKGKTPPAASGTK